MRWWHIKKMFWNECDCSNLLLNTWEMYKIWNLCKIAQVSYFVHFKMLYTFKNPKVLQGKRIFINIISITKQDYKYYTKETRGLILFHSHIIFWQLSLERNSSFSITKDKTFYSQMKNSCIVILIWHHRIMHCGIESIFSFPRLFWEKYVSSKFK